MNFHEIHCTESLAAELGLPSGLFQDKHRNPMGRVIVCDMASKVALIPNPLHHSCYPDQDFTLVVNGECLVVWDKPGGEGKPHRVEIYLGKGSEHFEDAILVAMARNAFAAWRGVREPAQDLRVEVRGRTPPLPAMREPQAIAAYLNRFTALLPKARTQQFSNIANQFLVPTLVKPNELDAFIQYGTETGWSDLTDETRKLFGESLESLASKPRESSSRP